jgi:hypothetical protein
MFWKVGVLIQTLYKNHGLTPGLARRNACRPKPKHILVIDIGGTHAKWQLDARGAIGKISSGPHTTPLRMVRQIETLTRATRFDAVSIGYPGVVVGGRIIADPHNLGAGWIGFDFGKAFGKPSELCVSANAHINNADSIAIGLVEPLRAKIRPAIIAVIAIVAVDRWGRLVEFKEVVYRAYGSRTAVT